MDDVLLLQLHNGSREAFTHIYNYYQPRVLRYITPFTYTDSVPAEEIIQEVFIRLWMRRRDLLHVKTLEPYLKKMAGNHLLNIVKARRIKERHESLAADFSRHVDVVALYADALMLEHHPWDLFGNFVQYVYEFRLFTLLRFGEWEKILAEPDADASAPYACLLGHFARGMALSHLSRIPEAERELILLRRRAMTIRQPNKPFSVP
jgi:RNA polymerase sigma-70 factor (ECF subfamily)